MVWLPHFWFSIVKLITDIFWPGQSSENSPIDTNSRQINAMNDITSLMWNRIYSKNANNLVCPTTLTRDVLFINTLWDNETLANNRSPVKTYPELAADITASLNHFKNVTSGEIQTRTELFSASLLMNRTLDGLASAIYTEENLRKITWSDESSIRLSFNVHTFTTFNVRNMEGDSGETRFSWSEPGKFTPPDSAPISVEAACDVGNYDYAKFQMPDTKRCTAEAVRLEYTSDLFLIIVMPDKNQPSEKCSSSANLWKNMRNVDFGSLQYTKRSIYLKVPIFKTEFVYHLKDLLSNSKFGELLYKYSQLYRTAALSHSVEFNFDPIVPEGGPIPMIAPSVKPFKVDRPFFMVIQDKMSKVTAFAGLINDPTMKTNNADTV